MGWCFRPLKQEERTTSRHSYYSLKDCSGGRNHMNCFTPCGLQLNEEEACAQLGCGDWRRTVDGLMKNSV
ncbi:unnamed protein product [Calypogeia fissa]